MTSAGIEFEGISKRYNDVGNSVLYEICELEGISREQLNMEHIVVLVENYLKQTLLTIDKF